MYDKIYLCEVKKKIEKAFIALLILLVSSSFLNAEDISETIDKNCVFIEGGLFLMGKNEENEEEKSTQKVLLDSFYMSNHEVTNREYCIIMGDKAISFYGGLYHPVTDISWYDAIEFCNELSVRAGLKPCYNIDKQNADPNNNGNDKYKWTVVCDFSANGYRLPTEAEWEYAARGGKKSHEYVYSGSNDIDKVGWYWENSFYYLTDDFFKQVVGTKLPNELGLYDMTGNVWEWCWDWYGEYSFLQQTNPVGALTGSTRVIRGGSWISFPSTYSVTYRAAQMPDNSLSTSLGFRIVKSGKKEEKSNFMKSKTDGQFAVNSFIKVDGGRFQKGSKSVNVDAFLIGMTEVTQWEWKTVMGNDPSSYGNDIYPVENVSWYDAVVYCNKRSLKEGLNPVYSVKGKINPDDWNYEPCKGNSITEAISVNNNANGYRLPTEIEWEYAASGGKKSKGYLYSGSDNIDDVAWFNSVSPHVVTTKGANELGLYDMSGNVWEYCSDWYNSEWVIIRGGSWYNDDSSCKIPYSAITSPFKRSSIFGFRIVRSLPVGTE
ncbi:MAG: SUMF1/EgtB/PvdO family nonheme iron enzyme [Treponema sp.]|nr:SUMF1/EgtB/PvdO family nonheme iron enzyme [Treponema sp.]